MIRAYYRLKVWWEFKRHAAYVKALMARSYR